MNVLDLFSGIGGFSLGLERAGMRTIAFCEIDPFPRAVLAERWPGIPCDTDIIAREFIEGEADVICGGFPCQDISTAGSGTGLAGERSGLWRELLRAIRVVRPRYAIVENVAALLSRGMGTVLGDLAEVGYDAEWHCIPASAIGAPHRRDRVWIIADTRSQQHKSDCPPFSGALAEELFAANANADVHARRLADRENSSPPSGSESCDDSQGQAPHGERLWVEPSSGSPPLAYTDNQWELQSEGRERDKWRRPSDGCWWIVEPDVGRVAHGIPSRVDRLKGLGNAVVPQIPEIIGRAIMKQYRDVVGKSEQSP